MPTTMKADKKLERAYVESKVIRSGLDHLASRLDAADDHLRDDHLRNDLRAFTERFDGYMRELHEACNSSGRSEVSR